MFDINTIAMNSNTCETTPCHIWMSQVFALAQVSMEDAGAPSKAQDIALNGAQVASAVDICIKVSIGQVAPDAAVMMLVAFFQLPAEAAQKIVDAQVGLRQVANAVNAPTAPAVPAPPPSSPPAGM